MSDKVTIVIIDDEAQTVSMLKSFLELYNYRVVTAFSGKEGLEAIHKHRPNAVLLDLMLTDVDGNELCRTIRQDPNTSNIPIIILSARSSRDDVKRGYASGATRYLKKPVDLDQLATEVAEVIDMVNHRPPPEAQQDEHASRPASGLMHSGTIQSGLTLPLSGDEVDFVIGGEEEGVLDEEYFKKHGIDGKNETVRLKGLYIKRDQDETDHG